jgi:hypothetical protein
MATIIYSQDITVELQQEDNLSYTCTVTGIADGDDDPWTVTNNQLTRGAALREALDAARHQMRLEIDVA